MSEPTITVSNLVCVTYQANAHVLPYHFVGKTETEAKAKMQEWLDNKITVKTDDEGKEIPVNVGRGTANNGKVWMINHAMKSRARVSPEEVDSFKNNGYILGGPKSAFV